MTNNRKTKADKVQADVTPTPVAQGPSGKLGMLVDLMSREEGARIDEMVETTGWQAHSVRGAISGSLKKKLGLEVISERGDAGRVYSIKTRAQA